MFAHASLVEDNFTCDARASTTTVGSAFSQD
jgi:hypothetical protein